MRYTTSAVGVFMWGSDACPRSRSSRIRVQKILVGQSFSALCASSLEYVSAVSGFHSLSEAMLLFSLTLFRLISSEHRMHLLYVESEAFRFSADSHAFYTMTFYIITCTPLFCQVFFEKNNFLSEKNCFLLTNLRFVCYNNKDQRVI